MDKKKDIPYEKVIKDLTSITDKFKEVSCFKKKEIEDIEQTRRQLDIVKDYWKANPNPPSSLAYATLTSAASYIHEFKSYVNHIGPSEFTGSLLGTAISSGDSIVATGMTLSYIAPTNDEAVKKKLEVKFVEIKEAPRRKNRRKEIKRYLKKLSPHLASAYEGAWENLETNFSDSERGAAFLMREVVSQVLDILAPKEAIKTSDFIPDPTAKDGVTRKHRLEYIATHKAKGSFSKELLDRSIQGFLDTYEGLNDAHKRTFLDKSKIESFLFQADDLLHTLFNSVIID